MDPEPTPVATKLTKPAQRHAGMTRIQAADRTGAHR